MLALVLEDAPRVRHDHPQPRRPRGEALIGLAVAGVCDTDLQLAAGYMNHRGVLGHEFVGRVLEADSDRWKGKRVVADINAGCGHCTDCLERRGHHCTQRSVLGILQRDGAMAEWLSMPEHCLVEVPDHVSDDLAVFAEPLAAALHVLDDAPPTEPIAVVGDGKLGLLIALALRSQGRSVLSIGHHQHKLAIAAAAGASTSLETEIGGSSRFAVVVEATGNAAGLERAMALTAPRGTLVLKTTVAGKHAIDLSPVVINELRVIGSRCGDLQRAIEVLAQGKLDPTPLIAARYPLARADQALTRAAERGALKVLIDGPSRAHSTR